MNLNINIYIYTYAYIYIYIHIYIYICIIYHKPQVGLDLSEILWGPHLVFLVFPAQCVVHLLSCDCWFATPITISNHREL